MKSRYHDMILYLQYYTCFRIYDITLPLHGFVLT